MNPGTDAETKTGSRCFYTNSRVAIHESQSSFTSHVMCVLSSNDLFRNQAASAFRFKMTEAFMSGDAGEDTGRLPTVVFVVNGGTPTSMTEAGSPEELFPYVLCCFYHCPKSRVLGKHACSGWLLTSFESRCSTACGSSGPSSS